MTEKPAPERPQRDKPWVMRTYAGHSSAAESNALYRRNLTKGQTGLSVAFDLPTQTGYDPDSPLARGEVGKVGVPVVHLGEMRRLFEDIPDRMRIERVAGLPLLSIYPSKPRGWQFRVKYVVDRVLAAAALLVAAPVMLPAALGVLITTGRPILFRQRRVGLDGHEFQMLKFRTMHPPAERAERSIAEIEEALLNGLGPGGIEGEDRRSRFGLLLRRTSIDELPQLINVLRGEMSLVGPRPERDHIATKLKQTVYRYADRARVKSGITGWAQVHGLRGRTSLADRVEWDNYYIDNWSLWLDFKIALMTIAALFRDRFD
jgi:lipopolysaccharide/colanic/teichoic acid biosynthesis glycosyltransferase